MYFEAHQVMLSSLESARVHQAKAAVLFVETGMDAIESRKQKEKEFGF
jgi:hypothetical protein